MFVAVDVPPGAGAHLWAALPVGPRWIPAQRWHLTLAFLGEVSAGRVPPLLSALDRLAGALHPVLLRLSGAGTFRTGRGSGVVWIGVDGEALTGWAGAVRSAVAGTGLTVAPGEFRAHLTVARWRAGVRPEVTALASYAGPAWTAERIDLIRSHLGAQQRYETLGSWGIQTSARGAPLSLPADQEGRVP